MSAFLKYMGALAATLRRRGTQSMLACGIRSSPTACSTKAHSCVCV